MNSPNSVKDLINFLLYEAGPIGGFVLLGGIIIFMVEAEELVRHIIHRIREDCNRRKKH
mgnify:CR=1 FL=1